MENNVLRDKLGISTTCITRTHTEQEITWKSTKTMSDIFLCTSMIKPLQQPNFAPEFVKYILKMPWTITPAAVD